MRNTKKAVTAEGNAPQAKPFMWLYRGYTITYIYDGSSYPYCYRITEDETNIDAGIWGAKTFLKAQKLVDKLIKPCPICEDTHCETKSARCGKEVR